VVLNITMMGNTLGVGSPASSASPASPAGTSSGSAQAQHNVILETPTKPKRTKNPYLKMQEAVICTPENPYKKSAAASTPSTISSMRSKGATNPYIKKPESRVLTPFSSPKRCLEFSCEGTSPLRRKISSRVTEERNSASALAIAIDLSKGFSHHASIDKRKLYTLYFDGGSRGNPGKAGAGMVLYDGEEEIWNGKEYIGDKKTNNEAEYTALVTGLGCAKLLGVERIHAIGDSKLVVFQVLGKWNCNKPHLRRLLQQVLDVRQEFKSFVISHVGRGDNKRADELANIAMDERVTCFGAIDLLRTPSSSQEEVDNYLSQVEIDSFGTLQSKSMTNHNDNRQNIEEELNSLSQSNDEDDECMSYLPFICQFEMERLNMRKKLRSGDHLDRLKATVNAYRGKPSLTRELISFIYSEEGTHSTPPYDDYLKYCANNGHPVDEADSCLFLFHAKLTATGIKLLPPEPADVFTRRIHRRFGTHRFLDLRSDEKCTATLAVLKSHIKEHFRNNKLELAGRKYGVLYSNASQGKTVIFRLFAESGVGIRKCDEICSPQVAACCIPPSLNPGLSLTTYMKRMKLSFTSTMPSFVLEPGMLEVIPDIKAHGNTGNVMTDGCGLISRQALNKAYVQFTYNAEKRCKDLGNPNATPHSEAPCPYSSFQGRIGGIKGMFAVDDSLDGVKVLYRPSQLKYDTPITKYALVSLLDEDNSLHNTVEIKEWDRPPPRAHLCQTTIQLLEERGVAKEYFLLLAEKEINELKTAREDYKLLTMKCNARNFCKDSNSMFDDDLLIRMLHARVPLDEPVMMCKINQFCNEELKRYREKSKFPVMESMYLRMLPDHTGLLESNEVFVALGDESAQYDIDRLGSIIAMRLPSYFVGDLRKFNNVVSKAELLQRCPKKAKFFCGIVAGLILSTKGARSEAEMMSGGDFDGDKAWCCWNEVIVSSVRELQGHNTNSNHPPTDPFKKRIIAQSDPEWTNLIVNYTMQHRHDKKHLGKLVKTLEMMRDRQMFNSYEVDKIARKAHIQVDNPHMSQWTETDQLKLGTLPVPHWFARKTANSYRSKRVLGELFDMLDMAGEEDLNYCNIEEEMNAHVREVIEKAYKKNCNWVDDTRKDMLRRLSNFNKAMGERIRSCNEENEVDTRLKSKAISGLFKQHRMDIENTYEDDDIPKAFAILYEQTYFQSRDRMRRWNKKPYVFAWEVGHDHLTRIIADGEAKRNCIGVAPTIARGNERLIFGKRR